MEPGAAYLAALDALADGLNLFYGAPTGLLFEPASGVRRAFSRSPWGPSQPVATDLAPMEAALAALPATTPIDLLAFARCHPSVVAAEGPTLAPTSEAGAEAALLEHLGRSWNGRSDDAARAAVRALAALGARASGRCGRSAGGPTGSPPCWPRRKTAAGPRCSSTRAAAPEPGRACPGQAEPL